MKTDIPMPSLVTTAALAIVAALSIGADGAAAPSKAGSPNTTPSTVRLIAAGRAQFLRTCAACHGPNAEGGDGPNLHQVNLPKSVVAYDIAHGFKGEMPAFESLNPAQISSITAYVESLK